MKQRSQKIELMTIEQPSAPPRGAPIMFNVIFLMLQRSDYPDILRRPTGEVLTRFHKGGRRLVTLGNCSFWRLCSCLAVLFPR
jgi:hypothetical protein